MLCGNRKTKPEKSKLSNKPPLLAQKDNHDSPSPVKPFPKELLYCELILSNWGNQYSFCSHLEIDLEAIFRDIGDLPRKMLHFKCIRYVLQCMI